MPGTARVRPHERARGRCASEIGSAEFVSTNPNTSSCLLKPMQSVLHQANSASPRRDEQAASGGDVRRIIGLVEEQAAFDLLRHI